MPALLTDALSRRQWLGTVAALSACPGVSRGATTPWPRLDAEPAGLSADLGAQLDQAVQSGAAPNLHAVCIVRHGALVFEHHGRGADERWGAPLGQVTFQADTRHDLRSVTKSVVGLLYGIALAQGKVPALDTAVVDAFAAYADLAGDPKRRRIRISDVLAMTMGLEWNEDLPYSDRRNSEIAMENSPDRYRYVLERPIVAEPGVAWRYSGGATALLGHLIAQGTGLRLEDFARSHLFSPLGIEDVEWVPGLNGEASAASGLRLRAADLAKLGQLVLQQGQWAGRSVVPANWVAASLTPRAEAFQGVKYGYHWYLAQRGETAMVMGLGWGGQRLVVLPALDTVYVIFMGNYQRPPMTQLKAVFAVQAAIHSALR